MAKLTKKEFAKGCEITTSALSNYISRGKVILDGEFINPENETNRLFRIERLTYRKKTALPEISDTTQPSEPPETPKIESTGPGEEEKLNERSKTPKEVTPEFKFPAEHAPISRNLKLDQDIKEIELEKSRYSSALLKSKLEKITGDTFPTELAKGLMLDLTKSITTTFHEGLEDFITRIAKMKSLDLMEVATLRDQGIEIINSAVNEAIELSRRNLDNIISEYSQKKDVGERE